MLSLPEPVEVEDRRPTTRERVGWSGEISVADGHFQEETRVKESFEDRARVLLPRGVHVWRELLAGALANDLEEPGVQRTVRKKTSKRGHDPFRPALKSEHLVAMVVEAIDRILVAPMAARIVEQCLQARQLGFQAADQF